ncbi:MAG: hypothetical protein KBC44_03305 [Candidatus Pacebacteria bacterium]|nr:hypothetical protein [Candidatus Paceibacterota bacterium]
MNKYRVFYRAINRVGSHDLDQIVTELVNENTKCPRKAFGDIRDIKIGMNFVEIEEEIYAIVFDLDTRESQLYCMRTGRIKKPILLNNL